MVDFSGATAKPTPVSITTDVVRIDQLDVMREVARELGNQLARWGVQNHGAHQWLGILNEEVGEAAKEANDCWIGGGSPDHIDCYRAELVQAAAVAVAAIENLDRQIAGAS